MVKAMLIKLNQIGTLIGNIADMTVALDTGQLTSKYRAAARV
ncbi:MAG: hypothetical protein AWT59_2677 [Candidatus Gallionella acididurans]|uniref:Uncharacterized protein n=1 Tax=Candidatus Gallionella acididurans TaxID=1796491 RepID=A0A139BQE4_9PROT|nr:MAG: hypothetical protein AWT59_2677 [Candidatus Gallionella acididurans]